MFQCMRSNSNPRFLCIFLALLLHTSIQISTNKKKEVYSNQFSDIFVFFLWQSEVFFCILYFLYLRIFTEGSNNGYILICEQIGDGGTMKSDYESDAKKFDTAKKFHSPEE